MPIEPFTLVGATTRHGALTSPLRARFGLTLRMDFYPQPEIEEVVRRTATVLNVVIDADAVSEISRRSRGTPRVANRILRRVRDFAQVRADGEITTEVARDALRLLEVDEFGLDDLDVRMLRTIIEKFAGGPVGIQALAASIGEDSITLEEANEPFLVQSGLVQRTPRGRAATLAAYKHLGYPPPAPPTGAQPQLF
jgi:Holliday junction DNA helicase RuvB